MFFTGCWSLLTALVVFLAAPSGMAAVTLLAENTLVWDFTLVRTAGGSDTLDQLWVSFGVDKLSASDHMLLTLAASGQAIPVHSKDWTGSASGADGIWMLFNWDTAFPDHTGSLTLELLSGSLYAERTTLIVVTPDGRWVASATPNVTLVPEPQLPLMVAAAMLPWLLRRRRRGAVAG